MFAAALIEICAKSTKQRRETEMLICCHGRGRLSPACQLTSHAKELAAVRKYASSRGEQPKAEL
jgi:hypothetical protein